MLIWYNKVKIKLNSIKSIKSSDEFQWLQLAQLGLTKENYAEFVARNFNWKK